MRVIKLFFLIVWAIIGIIFWIPFLMRILVASLARIFIDSILTSRSDVNIILSNLNIASNFYANGFKLINLSFNQTTDLGSQSDSTVNINSVKTLLIHLFEASVFWFLSLYFTVGGNIRNDIFERTMSLDANESKLFSKNSESEEFSEEKVDYSNNEMAFLYSKYKHLSFGIKAYINGRIILESPGNSESVPKLTKYQYMYTGNKANEELIFNIFPSLSDTASNVGFSIDYGLYFEEPQGKRSIIYLNRKSSLVSFTFPSKDDTSANASNQLVLEFGVKIPELKPGIYGVYVIVKNTEGENLRIIENPKSVDQPIVSPKIYQLFSLQ